MGNCTRCGKWAGLFKTVHPECREKDLKEAEERREHEQEQNHRVEQIRALIAAAPEGAVHLEDLAGLIAPISGSDTELVLRGFSAWIADLVASGDQPLPTDDQIALAGEMVARYGFSPDKLPDQNWDRFIRLCVMHDLQAGKLPDRLRIGGHPFNLEAGEQIVWLFNGVSYFEDKVMRSPARAYGGLSVRVASGVYLHGGESAPAPTTEGFVPVDRGFLALTDRAVLFAGEHKGLRLKYKDLVSFERFDNGFSVCKGSQSARSQGFELRDVYPGFPFSLLQALAKLAAEAAAKPKGRNPLA